MAPLEPPCAERRPHAIEAHGHVRTDPWHWLRDVDDPAVRAHLEAENAHTEAATGHTGELQERLFEEFRSRILESDTTVPAKKGGWWYFSRTIEGLQYAVHCRRRGAPDGPEEVVLDENALAAGHDYLSLGNLAVSPDHRLLAYAVDTEGDEEHMLRVRDLATGEDLPDRMEGTSYGLVWSASGDHLFYTTLDEAHRPHRLWRHRLGADPSSDVLVFEEPDEAFHLSVDQTRSDAWLVVTLESQVTTEVWVQPLDRPEENLHLVAPRRPGIEYRIDHTTIRGEDRFLIVTNDGAEDFRLVSAPVTATSPDQWDEVVPSRPGTRLDGIDCFAGHVVLYERADAGTRLAVRSVADGRTSVVEQPEAAGTVWGDVNAEFHTSTFRYGYQSMVTPVSVFDLDLDSLERTLLKQKAVLGGYDPGRYRTERLWAEAPDGEQVPLTLVARADHPLDGSAPCLLEGYGAYEASMDPWFSPMRLSLLDRGFCFAVAHARGGGEQGRRWYLEGKLAAKPTTFADFVACAEHLVAEGWTSPQRLVARGGSAGGLLMGAVANLRPELFCAIVAEVPFVDVVTTMLDDTLPLTVIEREEWGDPAADPAVYEAMLSYSPYDNVREKPYPAMLVTAGLNDPRVGFWEPAKWVQRLRAVTTGDRPILLKTELDAGHMGPSGRYDAWKEEAFVYSFILDAVGISS